MNSNAPDPAAPAAALGRLEGWLETMRGKGGYGGPAIGLRGAALAWCGPGHDWRWEGLLDGWIERHRQTGEPAFLDCIEQALRDLAAAQLGDGAFRNSGFEFNPFEGGMPHEPAVMAAAMRAVPCLRAGGRPLPHGVGEMFERFVEQRLVRELWNKTLQTFNNWLQSDFESYAPAAVAAAIEALEEYATLTGTLPRWEHYLHGAGKSLLACRVASGPLAGALPLSNRGGAAVSPYLAARCLPALDRLARRTDDTRYRDAADGLRDFLVKHQTPGGGFAWLAHGGRPAAERPVLVGGAAGVLVALHRAGRLDAATVAAHLPFVLRHQSASGAFDTAVGFDRRPRGGGPPDWRDVLPVCGWNDKVYHLLSLASAGPAPAAEGTPVDREVRVRGRPARFLEDADRLALSDAKGELFVWRKRTVWPEVCRL